MTMTPEQDEQLYKDFSEGMMAWDEIRRKKAIKALFTKNGINDEFNDLRWFEKPFYWVKTLVCLLLKRTGGSYLNNNAFCIATWDEHPSCGEYSGYDWDSCWIEIGLFKNWRVCICSDSSY